MPLPPDHRKHGGLPSLEISSPDGRFRHMPEMEQTIYSRAVLEPWYGTAAEQWLVDRGKGFLLAHLVWEKGDNRAAVNVYHQKYLRPDRQPKKLNSWWRLLTEIDRVISYHPTMEDARKAVAAIYPSDYATVIGLTSERLATKNYIDKSAR